MAHDVEAVRLAIASLFTNKPITPSQAMANLDIATKPSEDDLFESSAPVVRFAPCTIYRPISSAQSSKGLPRIATGEAPQTREDLEFWKHPAGYFVTIPGTKVRAKLCRVYGDTVYSIPKKVNAVAQKVVAKAEDGAARSVQIGAEQISTQRDGTERYAESDSDSLEDDYDSDSTSSGEEDESGKEVWSKYDVLRRTDNEDTLLGEDGDYSMYPDLSDESDED